MRNVEIAQTRKKVTAEKTGIQYLSLIEMYFKVSKSFMMNFRVIQFLLETS